MAQGVSFQQAVALANSGDAEAQYALSSALHERGQFDECLRWLRLAAAQRLATAEVTLATLLMDGRRCPRDLSQASELLLPLAATEARANLLLAELQGFAAFGVGDREAGLRHLMAAARMADTGALRQLALLAALHRQASLVQPLLAAAARAGDSFAAQALAGPHAPPGPGERPAASAIDWPMLAQALPRLAGPAPLPAAEVLHDYPLVRKFPRAIDPLVLDVLVHVAAPLVQRSQIVDASTGKSRADPMRTSAHVTLGPHRHDHLLEAIEACIGAVSGLPVLNGEFVQILRYRQGEQFRPHVDYFNEGGVGSYQSLADGGQRAQTVLIYLNEGYRGGTTRFPELGLDIQGGSGDLLHFHNLGADGLGHRDSLHAGAPVATGEKWLLSQWLRSARYTARLAW
ncbi:MAG: hypothetical protein RL684_1419 [Pseudomonadota bacterium]|jgi:prolyl 4-hydroxylase